MVYHVSKKFEQGFWHKLDWGVNHLKTLYTEINTFWENKPYEILGEFSADETQYVGRFKVSVEPPIERWSLILGDGIHNLRSSLDHIAYALVRANDGTPTKQTGFPIGEDLHAFRSVRGRYVKGMSKRAIKYINWLAPYGNGGNSLYYRLHALDINDKHRLLLPTLAGPLLGKPPIATLGGEPVKINVITSIEVPLKDGTKAYWIDIPPELRGQEVNVGFNPIFGVGMVVPDDESGIYDLDTALTPLANLVERTLNLLTKLL